MASEPRGNVETLGQVPPQGVERRIRNGVKTMDGGINVTRTAAVDAEAGE